MRGQPQAKIRESGLTARTGSAIPTHPVPLEADLDIRENPLFVVASIATRPAGWRGT